MRVSVFGLGYVGCVTAACLAKAGHEVTGVDINATKVAMVNGGASPLVEPGLDPLVSRVVGEGRLRATADAREAVRSTDLSLIAVGTPSRQNGGLDQRSLLRVAAEVGGAMRDKSEFHVVVLRSTVLPGVTDGALRPILSDASGRRAGEEFGLAINPEFMREGSAIADFYAPPFVVIGYEDRRSLEAVRALYARIDAPRLETSFRVAEMIKYASNIFHAVKICFANEIGAFCRESGIDSHELMRLFCTDRKLNVSEAYLRPGFAFGGSCLPKDLRAFLSAAKEHDLSLPMLEAILPSNQRQIAKAIELVLQKKRKRIGVLGLSFKDGTDDLRESPMVALVEALIGKGCDVRIYDKNVSLAKLVGANREYIEQELPHISSLLSPTLDEVLGEAEIIIVGTRTEEFRSALGKLRPEQVVIDLVRVIDGAGIPSGEYHGFN